MLKIFLIIFFSNLSFCAFPQTNDSLWHGIHRTMHYEPDRTDFICVNPTRRFNRALYGTNTPFRVEAGDLPEFAMYMPGMGGNCKFGLMNGDKSKWLTDAKNIKAIYRPGCMLYDIKDSMLGNGTLHITILALADTEGMIIKTQFDHVNKNVHLLWVFGGATGKKFHRDGDLGADPESSFYLQPSYCADNIYQIEKNVFHLSFGTEKSDIKSNGKSDPKFLSGIIPSGIKIQLADANEQSTPLHLYRSKASSLPVVTAMEDASSSPQYFLIQPGQALPNNYDSLVNIFDHAESAREKLVNRVKLVTPDKYINTLGGALAIAGYAIWESPSYMHGAIAWRMRLPGWRGPYVADPLGWHDRARLHFSSYALSQLTTPLTGPIVADTALHLARQLEKLGTSVFSSGYICRNPGGDFRPNHYDMNLVFVDALLNHFKWTGDTTYVKKMWPLLQRHLAWEKRNFDSDGDGLYDAYAAIWASDALEYSGGGVMHSSAYDYRANKMAAQIAKIIGEDSTAYQQEADHIYQAMNNVLWLPSKGWYAEYKDALGLKMIHPAAALWTIYQAIDSKVPDAFQAWQCLDYIDHDIPHIPVRAKDLSLKDLYVLSTTDWQPYTWSLNNVVLAENLQTSLAYWQGGRTDEAFRLWRSSLIQSMYLGASPGNFEQISFYDAARGELYRDFADPIGVAARTLIEGLFGVQPDALHNTLLIQPGLPSAWNFASLSVPDVAIDFKRTNNTDVYNITQSFSEKLRLRFIVRSIKDEVSSISINGKNVSWNQVENSIQYPSIEIIAPAEKTYRIAITWKGKPFEKPFVKKILNNGEKLNVSTGEAKVEKVYDPQRCISEINIDENGIDVIANNAGNKTFFIKVNQGAFNFWRPVSFTVRPQMVEEKMPAITSKTIFDTLDLHQYYNAKVTDIFKQQYLSPRVNVPTLMLPTQGIGNWCYPLTQANINDLGLRKLAGNKNEIFTPQNIPFSTPHESANDNIVFTSQWDNYPKEVDIALHGVASAIHLLMAGSTNPMQSRITNGEVIVTYTDDSKDSLQLCNPGNWWPIEQDYMIDGYAFTTGAPFPLRLYLKEGTFAHGLKKYTSISGYTNMAIDGGAATVLDMPLNSKKKLKSLTVTALANDVVIGLMSVTLQRN